MFHRRRTAWFRTLATFVAAWLPLVAGEPGLLQPCEMHGAERAVIASFSGQTLARQSAHHAAAGTSSAASAHGHHGSSGSAAAEMTEGTAVTSDHSAPASTHDQNHHNCSCIDGCCAAGAVAFVAPAPATTEFVAGSYAVVRSIPGVESFARPAPEFSRPYTTGPPRA